MRLLSRKDRCHGLERIAVTNDCIEKLKLEHARKRPYVCQRSERLVKDHVAKLVRIGGNCGLED